MAPITYQVQQLDDFVLTLSDDEEAVGSQEGNLKPAKAYSKDPKPSKKRKTLDEPTIQDAPKNKKAKKGKQKANTAKQAFFDNGTGSEEEGEGSQAEQGEDDGAMDSDFDFQLGDGRVDVVEDFDGWDTSIGKSDGAEGRNGRGLDLDGIIARRRAQADAGDPDANGVAVEDGVKDSEPEVSEDEVEIDVADALDDNDELLAEDGFGMGADPDDEEGAGVSQDNSDEGSDDDGSDVEAAASPVAHPDDLAQGGSSAEEEEEADDPAEVARREAFFAPEEDVADTKKQAKHKALGSFQDMSLSRPVLKGLSAVGFSEPTPIQSKTVPVALLGKDVVGGAVTGSGKTAAFLVPILERLLYRPKKVPTSRVAILMPTRELALQCFNVAKKLASFTDITFCKLIGGYSLREQESELRLRPDVIIATPGRFIDHMRNSASFAVDTLEILVLDEADRMLEDGFADELNEILTTIPKSRQTMLFSATMTDSVDKLIRVGMTRPVRLLVDAKKRTVTTLIQEFVRLRPGREDKRLGYLMLLCETTYTNKVIVFFRQKKEAHRVRVIFGLCGLKAAELHGSMTQEQRIQAVDAFRSGSVSFLLATDLASRGLDIKNVTTVLNYEAPQSHDIYLHRVGRTARAGRSGRACTLAAEADRKVVKAAVKAARAQGAKIVSRVVDVGAADGWAKKLEAMQDEVEAVLREEKEEKALGIAEREVRKGENLVRYEDEIGARPRRTWFESEKDKQDAKKLGGRQLNSGSGLGADGADAKKKPKGKLSGKERKKVEDRERRAGGDRMWKKGKGEDRAPPPGGKGKKKEKGGKGESKGSKSSPSKGKKRR